MTGLTTLAFLDGLGAQLRALNEVPNLNQIVLVIAVLFPLCVALSLTISGQLTERAVKITAMIGFGVTAIGAVWLGATYAALGADGGYAFTLVRGTGLESLGVFLHLGLNGISMPLFVMAGLVGLAAGGYAISGRTERLRLFLILLLVMQTGLMGLFASVDILFFYLFHEFALIPTFILIAMWGGRGRKMVALELTIYLTAGAMITLAGLLLLYLGSGFSPAERPFDMISLRLALGSISHGTTIAGLLLLGFGVLVSLFPFHSWAPKGYATAPAANAMLHAGVLKKFGLYGLIQIVLPVLPEGMAAWGPTLMWLALGNIVIIGFVTIAQRDLKLMLGNASVMHMGYAFLGLFAYSVVGVGGAVLMMFAHGLSIALLFLLADVVERRAGTTELSELGGLAQPAPVLAGFFVAAMMASIGLPGFANFWGELGIFVSLWQSATPWVLAPAILGIVLSAIYGLRAVSRVFFGEAKTAYAGGDLTLAEKWPAVLLLLGLFLAGFWPRLISDDLNAAVEQALEPAHSLLATGPADRAVAEASTISDESR
jgi:NADH-quinone oxidoreductase subunit M